MEEAQSTWGAGRGVKEDPGFWFGRAGVTVTRDSICDDEHEGLGPKWGWGNWREDELSTGHAKFIGSKTMRPSRPREVK